MFYNSRSSSRTYAQDKALPATPVAQEQRGNLIGVMVALCFSIVLSCTFMYLHLIYNFFI